MRKEWEHEKNRKTCIDSPDRSACDVRHFIYAGGIFCQSVGFGMSLTFKL